MIRKLKLKASIADRLREASKAYYETDKPLMTDAEYDELLEQLRAANPEHPLLSEVGAPCSNAVKLPVPMPSLDKKKPEHITSLHGNWILTEKLDGISALWISGYNVKPALYLRGNGVEGQDVSHCIKGIQGLKQSSAHSSMVRGELIIPKGVPNARNWVNGAVHRSDISLDDLKKIHFVAYQVCQPSNMSRSQQMTWLTINGFELAWNTFVQTLDATKLSEAFKTRRSDPIYECDGIVCGKDLIPETVTASNPKDAFAFKMPLDDQKATTVVREIEWASSRTGNWVPRIRFDPVKIGSATIEYCTGIHAKFISESRLGPGAKIIVRRSGDVIPCLDTVLEPVDEWSKPPAGRWTWDASHIHALDTTTEATPEKIAIEIAYSLTSLGIEGLSKVSTKKLVEAGLKDFKSVYDASAEKLQGAIGKANGQKLYDALASLSVSEDKWLHAFCGWPKGFGSTRILSTLTAESSVAKWPSIKAPKGQSDESFAEVQKIVPEYLKWRQQFGDVVVVPVVAVVPIPVATGTAKGAFVMSGFRDAALQQKFILGGWVEEERITKNTTLLIVPDVAKETGKVKDARAKGIRIAVRSEADKLV